MLQWLIGMERETVDWNVNFRVYLFEEGAVNSWLKTMIGDSFEIQNQDENLLRPLIVIVLWEAGKKNHWLNHFTSFNSRTGKL